MTTEEAWGHFQEAEQKLDEAWAVNDAMFSDKTSDNLRKGVTPEEFQASLAQIDRLATRCFRAYDSWKQLKRQEGQPVEAAVEDVRALAADTLKDNQDGIEFNVNLGILASNVARAIRGDITEDAELAPVFCEACS